MDERPVKSVTTDALRIAYVEHGPSDGWPVILSHGFPYDVHAFDDVASILARAGARVIAPYTRGFGPTRFVSDAVMRSGQQAARGSRHRPACRRARSRTPDPRRLRLGRQRVLRGGGAVAGPDRRPRILRGLRRDRCQRATAPRGAVARAGLLVSASLPDRARARMPVRTPPRAGRMLWSEWSPGWRFDEATFARSAVAFENPDFVDVVIHCYRSVFGLEAGDPALQPLEDRLAQKPAIRRRR